MVKYGPASHAKLAKLESLYSGCTIAHRDRNISPATKKILALLARQAKIAIENRNTDYDKDAFVQEVADIEAINNYVEKRSGDVERLRDYDNLRQMGDYASCLCKKLKQVKGTTFKEMFWIQIVEKLDTEIAAHRQWVDSDRMAEEPKQLLHEDLMKAMEKCKETDYEQGFWEIRQYARRNGLMHCGILDQRVCGKYDEVLSHIKADLVNLTASLPASERVEAHRYRRMIARFRLEWFEPHSIDEHHQVTWKRNAVAEAHLKELESPVKIYHQSENDLGKLHKTFSELTKELKEVKDALKKNEKLADATKRIALATLNVAANATPKPNEAQKRYLEEHEVYTPEKKKRKLEEIAAQNGEALDEIVPMQFSDD